MVKMLECELSRLRQKRSRETREERGRDRRRAATEGRGGKGEWNAS